MTGLDEPLWAAPIDGTPARLACLADVHGNTAALDAVLTSAEFAAVDAVAFLGCLTTGPDPLGVLDRCAMLDVPAYYLAGNGERAVLARADGNRDVEWAAGDWIVQRHRERGLATIRSWPPALVGAVAGLGGVRLCHGSPRSDVELLTPRTSAERIKAATAGVTEPVVVHGHTHLQYERSVGDVRIVAPGSVGMPYTDGPFGARWAVLGPDVDLLLTPYDFGEAERRVLATGYPSESYLRALRTPPSPAEIIADAEARHFSD